MSRKELLKHEELYKAGAIAEEEILNMRGKILEQEQNLGRSKLELEQK